MARYNAASETFFVDSKLVSFQMPKKTQLSFQYLISVVCLCPFVRLLLSTGHECYRVKMAYPNSITISLPNEDFYNLLF